jgi:hypothetical protein
MGGLQAVHLEDQALVPRTQRLPLVFSSQARFFPIGLGSSTTSALGVGRPSTVLLRSSKRVANSWGTTKKQLRKFCGPRRRDKIYILIVDGLSSRQLDERWFVGQHDGGGRATRSRSGRRRSRSRAPPAILTDRCLSGVLGGAEVLRHQQRAV